MTKARPAASAGEFASLTIVGLLLALAFGAAALPWIMPDKDATARCVRRHLHLRRELPCARHRQGAGPVDRSRRRGAGRRLPDGGIRRRLPRRGLPGGRSGNHHAAARHDDRGRQPAHLRVLRAGQRLGGATRAPAVAAAGGDRRGIRRVLRLPGERCDLPGHGAAGSGTDSGAWTQSGAISAGRGDGVECRFNRDDHRQSAEHDDRQLLPHSLHPVCRVAGAGGS